MFRSLRTTLLLFLLLMTFSSSALARMVIGVTPTVFPGIVDRSVLVSLQTELSSRYGEVVQVRTFDNESIQLDWLIRFRELDAALISRDMMRSLPAGTLINIADLATAVAVTHSGIPAEQTAAIQRAVRSLSEDERGRQLLNRLTGTAKAAPAPKTETPGQTVSAPSKPLVRAAVPSVTAQPPVAPLPVPRPAPEASPAATKPVQPKPPTTASPPPIEPKGPDVATTRPGAIPAAPPGVAPQPKAITWPKLPPAAPAPTTEPTTPERTRLLLVAALVILVGIGAKLALLFRRWGQLRRAPDAPPRPPSAEAFDYQTANARSTPATTTTAPAQEPPAAIPVDTIGDPAAPPAKPGAAQPVVLRVNTAGKGKVNFDFRAPTPVATLPSTPPVSPLASDPLVATTEPAINKSAAPRRRTAATRGGNTLFPPATEELVVEQGRLGKTKVPALLKRCAGLPQPVVLRVRTLENEICVHFVAGQICHAYSRDWRVEGKSRQWSRLGYLMVREGLLTEVQQEQALELIERQDGLRPAAALQQIGCLDIEALRHILARQAKTTLFALILFSAGEYRIEADDNTIPAEESISLQVEELIREASHHQSEWIAIRKVLPTQETLLDFASEGREKLDQVRLSVHQQWLLSLIDGQTSVGTLCNASAMMEYEVCRFLYLMTKAGVLQVLQSS